MPYVPLHVHSINSPYSGMLKVEEIVSRAAFLKFPAIALTDRWTTYGHHAFYREALSAGVKPVLGLEARHVSVSGGKGLYHLTLLAKDRAGYRNLAALAGRHHEKEKAEYVTEQELVLHSEGLIALTGCLGGEAAQAVLHGNLSRMRAVVERLFGIYGRDDVYLEIMNHNIDREQFVTEQFMVLAKKLRVPMVATNNDKFSLKEEAEYYSILRRMSGEETRTGLDVLAEYRLKKRQELEPFFFGLEEALEESGRIAERCEVDLELESSIRFADRNSSAETLRRRCERRFLLTFHSRKRSEAGQLRSMIESELKAASDEGLSGYLLFMAKLFDRCRRRGVRLELAGGELLDSLAAYLLDIVPLDPVEHGLVFESFNAPRPGVPPQTEIIKPKGTRKRLLEVISDLLPGCGIYNQVLREEKSIVTILREVVAVSDLPAESRDALTEAAGSSRKKDSLQDLLENSDQLNRLYNEDAKVRRILSAARALSGRVHQFNHNTSRLVVLPPDLESIVGCVRSGEGPVFCLVDGRTIEKLGGWVVLVQSSHFLTALESTITSIRGGSGEDAGPDGSPAFFEGLDDRDTYAMISSGDTTGVYLLESRGIRELLEKIRPDSFDGLVNVISLYRPAPLEGRLWQRYIDNAEKKGKVFLPHHSLAPALEPTRGLLLYRQQVREILADAAGIRGEDAVFVEKALSGRGTSDMARARLNFIRNAMEMDVNEEDAQRIFDFLLHNTGFTYDKAFGCAQAYISYRTAYMKAHHHDRYFTSLLNCTGDARDRRKAYLDYLQGANREVLPADVNSSGVDYTVEPGGIRSPLNESRVLDDDEVSTLLAEREAGGQFESMADFLERTASSLPMSSVYSVIEGGLFDFLMRSHDELKDEALAFYEKHARAGEFFKQRPQVREKREESGRQLSFFDDDGS